MEKIDKALLLEAISKIQEHIEDLLREEYYGDMTQHHICMAKVSAYKAAIREIKMTCRLD